MKYTGALLLGALLVGGATRAEALALTPADTTCTTNVNSNLNATALYTQLDGCFDVTAPAPLALIYKQGSGTGGTEEGSYASSYSTSFIDDATTTGTDWAGATISYGSGSIAFCTECYLVVKDGNNTPAQYFFDISGWNGTDDISLTGFWTGRGSISHVSIHGVATDPPREDIPPPPGDKPPSVPEPASFMMIGAGFAMAALRLRRKR